MRPGACSSTPYRLGSAVDATRVGLGTLDADALGALDGAGPVGEGAFDDVVAGAAHATSSAATTAIRDGAMTEA